MKKTVLISGISSGIGYSLGNVFNNHQFKVIGLGRRDNTELQENIEYYKCDVSQSIEIENLFNNKIPNSRIDCLINNAGVTSFKPFIENNLDDINSIIDTNLKGAIHLIQSVLPQMIKNNSGTIINIISVAAKKIFQQSSIYSASKAGLEMFSKVLREELRENNIKIINVYPGATATEIWPKDALEKFGNRMMSHESVAEVIYNLYNSPKDVCSEEIVLRPITGDL